MQHRDHFQAVAAMGIRSPGDGSPAYEISGVGGTAITNEATLTADAAYEPTTLG